MSAGNRPPRGYSWPQATPGNTIAQKHAAYGRSVIPVAESHARELIQEHAHLTTADWLAVRSLAIAEERVVRMTEWLAEHGDLDEDGNPRPALEALRKWIVTSSNLRQRLGLDPVSRASLAVDELHARRQAHELAGEDVEVGRRLREEEREA